MQNYSHFQILFLQTIEEAKRKRFKILFADLFEEGSNQLAVITFKVYLVHVGKQTVSVNLTYIRSNDVTILESHFFCLTRRTRIDSRNFLFVSVALGPDTQLEAYTCRCPLRKGAKIPFTASPSFTTLCPMNFSYRLAKMAGSCVRQ